MRRDWLGTILGLLVFAGGAALLVLVFKEAKDLYDAPQARALGIEKGRPLDLPVAGGNLAGQLVRVLLLALMAFVGGLVCRAGAQLYGRSLVRAPKPDDA